MRKKKLLLFLILLSLPAASLHQKKDDLHQQQRQNRANYHQVCKNIQAKRLQLKQKFQDAASDSQKLAIISRAKNLLFHAIYDSLIPFWYGTEWAFSGQTQVPGKGQIACGYFVTTILRDAGLKINRIRLAQWTSEKMIKSLIPYHLIKRFRNAKIEKFVSEIQNWGKGIYIVGLDCHTGFIVNSGEQVWFIHSSYLPPQKVIKEKAVDSPILSNSRYRVVGKLTADNQVLKKWILGESL